MSEDAPVNTGAVAWPDPDSAYFAVRRMQTKLHRWAGEDPGRRFGDLFNLVYDPAFLVDAWERVSHQQGATDRRGSTGHCGQDRDPGRGGGVPGPDPGLAEVWRVPAGRGAAGDDPQERRETAQARVSLPWLTGWSRPPEAGARAHLRGGLPAVLVRVPPEPARAGRDRRDPSSRIQAQQYHWVVEADIRACLDPWSYCSFADCAA